MSRMQARLHTRYDQGIRTKPGSVWNYTCWEPADTGTQARSWCQGYFLSDILLQQPFGIIQSLKPNISIQKFEKLTLEIKKM